MFTDSEMFTVLCRCVCVCTDNPVKCERIFDLPSVAEGGNSLCFDLT